MAQERLEARPDGLVRITLKKAYTDGTVAVDWTRSPRRRSSPTWARLIAKIYQVDPLVCTRCGRKMQMIAFLTDQLSIKRILDHLGLSEPPQASGAQD
jgi:hypothetical protein